MKTTKKTKKFTNSPRVKARTVTVDNDDFITRVVNLVKRMDRRGKKL